MRKLLAVAVLLFGLFGVQSGAQAATIRVDTFVDSNDPSATNCALRNAISSADTDLPGYGTCVQGNGTDVIQLPAGTYELTIPGPTTITGDLNVAGPGDIEIEPAGEDSPVTIDGGYNDRLFTHTGAGNLTIRNMALVKGKTPLAPDASTYGSEGGAIRSNNGTLTLQGLLLFDNRSGMSGGAVHNTGTSILRITNSTLSTNQASFSGGAIVNEGDGSASVRSSTITLNQADSDANGSGAAGGIVQDSSEAFSLTNSILADNRDLTPAPGGVLPDCRTGPNFFPRYVISTQQLNFGECLTGFDPGTNQSPVDPQLEGLADNLGTTFTHAIPPGSPAIDAGADGSVPGDACPPLDQRRVVRPAGKCDIGAYEYDPMTLPPTPLPGRAEPSGTIATYEAATGKLHIRLKCPARFKPKCISKALPLTAKRNGRRMAAVKRVRTVSNRFKRVTFQIKPAYRERVEAMTFVDRKKLIVKQTIKSKKVRTKKAKRPSIVFHTYKVRVRL